MGYSVPNRNTITGQSSGLLRAHHTIHHRGSLGNFFQAASDKFQTQPKDEAEKEQPDKTRALILTALAGAKMAINGENVDREAILRDIETAEKALREDPKTSRYVAERCRTSDESPKIPMPLRGLQSIQYYDR